MLVISFNHLLRVGGTTSECSCERKGNMLDQELEDQVVVWTPRYYCVLHCTLFDLFSSFTK